jgi:hypothetical protein
VTLLRIALASGLLLAPGALVSRALGLAGAAPALAWTLFLLFGAMGVTFLAGTGIWLTLVLLAAAAAAAGALAWRTPPPPRLRGWRPVLGAGIVLGLLLWFVAGEIGGDGLFHLARVRKLAELDALSLGAVNEFADGGLHPGYAFPLWHGFLALVAKLALVDPSVVVLHEASVLAPVALLVTYEAALALFRAVAPAVAAVAAQVALIALAPNGGGAYTALGLPATASRQLLVPAALALAVAAVASPSRAVLASAAAAGLALAVVHPTYAIFLWLPFAGFVLVRALVAPRELKALLAALAALVVPAGAYLAWLTPVVRATASHEPDRREVLRALDHYRGQLDVFSPDSYRLAPEVFGRGGSVAVAALLLLPLAGLALRRRWAAYVLGGSLAVFLVMLVPQLFTPFSDLVSLSQARRAAGFLPFAFALAGGLCVLARGVPRPLLVPGALAAGSALQLAWPGDFGYRLHEGGPALATWIALGGGAAALLLALRPLDLERQGAVVALAAVAFVLPVAAHAAGSWEPSETRRASHLTPGLVAALRERVPEGAVVYSDPETSYRIAAEAPVYIAVAPPGHVADTRANKPYVRRDRFRRFSRTAELGIPTRAGADWVVIDRRRYPDLRLRLAVVHRDGRFTLYRLS